MKTIKFVGLNLLLVILIAAMTASLIAMSAIALLLAHLTAVWIGWNSVQISAAAIGLVVGGFLTMVVTERLRKKGKISFWKSIIIELLALVIFFFLPTIFIR